MRGEVLHYDESQGFGFINGADGNRYTFRREDLRREGSLGKGVPVEFQPMEGRAINVFPIRASASVPAVGPAAQPLAQHFGRNAASTPPATAPASTGMWGYFLLCLTANYANFRDRARRKEYWSYALFWFIVMIAISLVGVALDMAAGNHDTNGDVPIFTAVGLGLWVLATIIPGIALSVRRLHDIGLSGWFALLFAVLSLISIGGLIQLVVALIPSQKHDNKWGPVPAGVMVSSSTA